MIICFRNGRLGNQIFQYTSIKSYAKFNEKIILIGFGDLYRIFETKDTIFFFKSKIFDFLFYPNNKIFNLDKFFRFLSNYFFYNLRIFKILYEDGTKNNFNVLNKPYIFKNIKFVKSFHGQSEKFIKNEKIKEFKIKKEFILKSKKILQNLNFKNLVYFVHMRRGDYIETNHNMKIDVPLIWYKLRMEELEKKYPKISFIVFSDDREISKKFDIKKNIFYSKENYLVDFTIMSECDGGILSPSSFSWWSAWFSQRNMQKSNKEFLAPNFWMGFSVNKWFPKSIKTNFIKYIDAYN